MLGCWRFGWNFVTANCLTANNPLFVVTIDDVLRNEADMAFRRRVRTVLELLAAQPGELVLDSGCGHGFYLRVLADLGCRRGVGVEDRQGALEQGKRETGHSGSR